MLGAVHRTAARRRQRSRAAALAHRGVRVRAGDFTDPGRLEHAVHGDGVVDGDQQRWPRFCPAAVTAGYTAMMSIPLSTEGHRRAVLNLYAPDPDTFDGSRRRGPEGGGVRHDHGRSPN